MRHIRFVTAIALLLGACASPPPTATDTSTAARPGSGPRPADYNISEIVVLEHVKAEDVVGKFQEMGVPEGMVIQPSPQGNSVLLTGRNDVVRQALAVVAAMDKQ